MSSLSTSKWVIASSFNFFFFAPQLNIKYLRKKLHKEYEMYPK